MGMSLDGRLVLEETNSYTFFTFPSETPHGTCLRPERIYSRLERWRIADLHSLVVARDLPSLWRVRGLLSISCGRRQSDIQKRRGERLIVLGFLWRFGSQGLQDVRVKRIEMWRNGHTPAGSTSWTPAYGRYGLHTRHVRCVIDLGLQFFGVVGCWECV